MKTAWKKNGFSTAKPKVPGVYFVRCDQPPRIQHDPKNIRDGWDVAQVIFFAGSFGNANDNVEEGAHWRIQTLSGLSYAWQKGMLIKGPISPFKASP